MLPWVLALCNMAVEAQEVGKPLEDKTPGYNIGVYYFPGWKDREPGAPAKYPWERLKSYPEREPLLGWYPEGEVAIAEQHIQWMHDFGIDFVAYDWYWSEARRPYLEHALRAYFRARNRNLVKFSVLWANHMKVPGDLQQFTSMVGYWIANYFGDDQYLTVDGRPVVFVFSQQNLRDNAKRFGMTPKALVNVAQDLVRSAGYPGIFLVAGAEAVTYWVQDYGPKSNYDAFSAYNYHRGFSGTYIPLKLLAHSYAELDRAYQQSWDWILRASPLPYVLPMTSGWDKRPWGGSTDPWHDDCQSTPDEFELHLRAAKSRIDRYREKTLGMGVICCWNEFGEGSYIEPTKRWGYQYLERVKKVFGVQESAK